MAAATTARRSLPRKILRWSWRIAAIFVGLLVLAVGGVLIAIHTTPGRAFITEQVNAKLADVFVGGAHIGSIEGSPFTTLVINDVVLDDPTGTPAVRIGRVELEVGLRPLIRKQLELHRVLARDVDVRMARDANGDLLIGKMIKPGPSSGFSIDLANLAIQRAHVAMQNGTEWTNIDALEAYGSASVPANGPIAATISLRAAWREQKVPLALTASVRSDDGVVAVPRIYALAGGVVLTGTQLQILTGGVVPRFSGALTVVAPKRAVAQLVPSVHLPDDIAATIIATDDAPWTRLSVVGTLGPQPLTVLGRANLTSKRVQALAIADGVDVTRWSNGKVTGRGGALVVVDGALGREGESPVAVGVLTAWGKVLDLPKATLASVFSYDGTHVIARAGADNGAATAAIAADVTLGDRITLDKSSLVATTTDPRAASGGAAPVRGVFDATFEAHGELSPVMDLAVVGKANGKHVGVMDVSVSSIKIAVDAKNLPSAPKGRAEVDVMDLVRGDMQLGQLKITAANLGDGSIAVAVRSRPKFAPWLIDLDAHVKPPEPRTDTWTIDLDKHRVRMGELGEWKGTTGHFEIGSNHYTISNFQSISKEGMITVNAGLSPHQLALDLRVARDKLGEARIVLDVDAPKQVTDVQQWFALDRSRIRSGEIEIAGVDLAEVGALTKQPGLSGAIGGKITVTPTDVTGKITARDVVAPQLRGLGKLNAALELAQSAPDEVTPSLRGSIGTLGKFTVAARMALPAHPLDPAAWSRLGLSAMRGATFGIDEISVEPGLLDKLGYTSELRAKVKLDGEIGEAMKNANVVLAVSQLRGDAIQKPIDVRFLAGLDDKGLTTSFSVTTGWMRLVRGTGNLPITMAQVFANPGVLTTAPLTATVIIPTVSAPSVLAVFGRTELDNGWLSGHIDVSGTLLAPKMVAKLEANKLVVPPGRRNLPVKTLEQVVIDASYDGKLATATIHGAEKTGSFDVVARVEPANLASGTASIKATSFDLQPLLVFAPGAAGAARGHLDADLKVTGFEPKTMRIAGRLKLTKARIPIAPEIGTLRRANLDIVISDKQITIAGEGKLGGGTVALESTIAMDGSLPSGGDVSLTLRKVSPIGSIEPKIDADVTAKIRREADRWVADVDVKNGKVDVPNERGEPLKPVGAPKDIVYSTTGLPLAEDEALTKQQPAHAVIVVNVTLHSTYVKSAELRGMIHGKLAISIDADNLGIVGSIEAERGDLDLFGRRYLVDRALVRFDGSMDPALDFRIIHDFSEVTTVTAIRGRLSKPELVLSSDPGIYSQDQLLGFLLGGEPNGDPQHGSASEVATSAAGSFIANKVGGYVKKIIPFDISVLKYAAATSTESAAVTVGTWLTRSLYLSYVRHLEARPDENGNEANLQYYLTRRLMIEGTTGDHAVSGIDLLWRKRY